MNFENHKKLEYAGYAFYVPDSVIGLCTQKILYNEQKGFMSMNLYTLTGMADFVVEKNGNTLVKCRYNLEEILDKALLKNNEET